MSADFEIVDHGWNKIKKELESFAKDRNNYITVGLHKGKKRVQIGFWNEFGTKNKDHSERIPERPFLQSSLYEKPVKDIETLISKEIQMIYLGGKYIVLLTRLGMHCKAFVKKQIIDKEIFKPNKASTIARKGFDHPLWETGEMYNEIDFKLGK